MIDCIYGLIASSAVNYMQDHVYLRGRRCSLSFLTIPLRFPLLLWLDDVLELPDMGNSDEKIDYGGAAG